MTDLRSTTAPTRPGAALEPALGLRGTWIAVGNEVFKGLRHGWAERTQILIELPLFVSFVLLISFIAGNGDDVVSGRLDWSLNPEHATWLFVGLGTYIFLYLQVQKMFWRLLAEIQTGTLEQTYLSPLPSWVHVLLGRAVASAVETALVVALIYGVITLTVELRFHWRLDALIPLAGMLVGGVGFSLVLAGLTLMWKRVEMVNDMVLLFAMFFAGAIVGLDQLPPLAGYINPFLFLTHVNEGFRITMFEGRGLAWWGTGGLIPLISTAAGWFVGGLLVFRACEHRARVKGTLIRY